MSVHCNQIVIWSTIESTSASSSSARAAASIRCNDKSNSNYNNDDKQQLRSTTQKISRKGIHSLKCTLSGWSMFECYVRIATTVPILTLVKCIKRNVSRIGTATETHTLKCIFRMVIKCEWRRILRIKSHIEPYNQFTNFSVN